MFSLFNKMPSVPDETVTIAGDTYKLTFVDDFDGAQLDKSKWSLCPQQKRQDVGGKWDDSCTTLDGEGNLILSAEINDKGVPVSGAIRSKGKFEQARGYYEVRCKLQRAPGFWGAFWLMCDGEKRVGNGAVDGAEIDIFESSNVFMKDINHAIHWDGYGDSHRSIAKTVHDTDCYDGEYHTFALLWTDSAYTFYIDGAESYRISAEDLNFPGSCEEKCYLKLSTEFGSWAGAYDAGFLPDRITVDYVKVYSKI